MSMTSVRGAIIAEFMSMEVEASASERCDTLDRASAFLCFFLALFHTVDLYDTSFCSHFSSIPAGCSMVLVYLRAWW